MNNVGEFFFSSPIDPLRPLEGLGPLGRRPAPPPGDQRRGPDLDGAGDDSLGASDARLPAERHAAGVLGAAVQHHVGRDDHPGHGRPAGRERRVHPTKRRRRQRLLQSEPAGEPGVPRRRTRSAGDTGGRLQSDQPSQRADAKHEFRVGRVPDESATVVRSDHGSSANRARCSSVRGCVSQNPGARRR